MIIYRIPSASTVRLEPLKSKLQNGYALIDCATPDFACGLTLNLGSFCTDGLLGDFFLSGQNPAQEPNCTFTVNGQPNSNCSITELEGSCLEGSLWSFGCDIPCDGSELVIVSCDGFEQATCEQR